MKFFFIFLFLLTSGNVFIYRKMPTTMVAKKFSAMQHMPDNDSYFGKQVSQKQLSKIILSEIHFAPHTIIPEHYHKNCYFSYIIKGQYSEIRFNTRFNYMEGDIIIYPGYLKHSNTFNDKETICFTIEFTDALQKEMETLKSSTSKIFESKKLIWKNTILKIYKEYKTNDQFSDVIIDGLLFETIANSAREPFKDVYPYWLKKAKTIIDTSYLSDISLSAIALALGITPSHLAREFKKAAGVTVGEYIKNIKIQRACEKLKTTNEDILSIALGSGFSDQSYFAKTFKKITGLTPCQYKSIYK